MISGLGVPMSFVIPSMILGLLGEPPKVPTVDPESHAGKCWYAIFGMYVTSHKKTHLHQVLEVSFFIYILVFVFFII